MRESINAFNCYYTRNTNIRQPENKATKTCSEGGGAWLCCPPADRKTAAGRAIRPAYSVHLFSVHSSFCNDLIRIFENGIFRDIASHHGQGVDIAAASNHRSGIQHTVASHFDKIAEHRPEFF